MPRKNHNSAIDTTEINVVFTYNDVGCGFQQVRGENSPSNKGFVDLSYGELAQDLDPANTFPLPVDEYMSATHPLDFVKLLGATQEAVTWLMANMMLELSSTHEPTGLRMTPVLRPKSPRSMVTGKADREARPRRWDFPGDQGQPGHFHFDTTAREAVAQALANDILFDVLICIYLYITTYVHTCNLDT